MGRFIGGRDIIPDMWPATNERPGVFVNIASTATPTLRPDGKALQEGDLMYLTSDDTLYIHNGTSFIAMAAASGAVSLQGAFNQGQSITIASGTPLVLNDAQTDGTNLLELNKTGAGSGNIIDVDITAAFTGDALNINMTNSAVTAQAIVVTGQAAARTTNALVRFQENGTGALPTVYIDNNTGVHTGSLLKIEDTTAVAAPVAGTDGLVTIVHSCADAAEALYISGGTGTRTGALLGISDVGETTGQMIRLVQTSTSAANAIQYTCSGAITGDAVNINLANAGATGQALVIASGAATTSNLVQITHDGTGAGNALAITASTTFGGDFIDLSCTGAVTGDFIAITFTNAGNGADGITMTGRPTGSTGSMILLTDAATTGTGPSININSTGNKDGTHIFLNIDGAGSGKGIHFDIDGANTGSKLHFDIDAATTGPIIDADFDSTGSSILLDIDIATSVWTGKMITFNSTQAYNTIFCDLTFTNCGAAIQAMKVTGSATTRTAHLFEIIEAGTPSGDVINITHGGASTGDSIHIDMTNAVGGRALNLDGAGTRTVNLIDIDTGGADTAATIAIDVAGAATRGAIAITTAAVGEAAQNVGAGLTVAGSGDLAASSDLVRFTTTGNISATSNVVAIEQTTGAGSAGAFGLYINCTGANVEALKVDAGTATFDETVTVTGRLTVAEALVHSGIETIAAGGTSTALSLTKTLHSVDADAGGDIFTLADGTIGQIMYITMASSTGTATITPTNLAGGTSVTFNAAGDSVILMFVDTDWYIIGGNSYTVV